MGAAPVPMRTVHRPATGGHSPDGIQGDGAVNSGLMHIMHKYGSRYSQQRSSDTASDVSDS